MHQPSRINHEPTINRSFSSFQYHPKNSEAFNLHFVKEIITNER